MERRGLGLLAVVAAIVIVAGVVIAGCGGGGTTTVTTSNSALDETGALAISAYIRQANLICKVSEEERERRLESANAWVDPNTGVTAPLREKIVRFAVIAPTEKLSAELEALGPVNGAEKNLGGFGPLLAEDTKRAREKPLTVFSGTAFKKSDAAARYLALDDCVI